MNGGQLGRVQLQHPLFRFLTTLMVSASEVFSFSKGGFRERGENETENRLLCVEKFSTFVSHTQNGVYLLALLCSGPPSISLSLFSSAGFVIYQNSLKCTHTHWYTIALSRSGTQN